MVVEQFGCGGLHSVVPHGGAHTYIHSSICSCTIASCSHTAIKSQLMLKQGEWKIEDSAWIRKPTPTQLSSPNWCSNRENGRLKILCFHNDFFDLFLYELCAGNNMKLQTNLSYTCMRACVLMMSYCLIQFLKLMLRFRTNLQKSKCHMINDSSLSCCPRVREERAHASARRTRRLEGSAQETFPTHWQSKIYKVPLKIDRSCGSQCNERLAPHYCDDLEKTCT